MKLSILTIALLSTLSATASAEGFFIGASVGQSYSNLCPSTNKLQYGCSNTGDAFGVTGGYNLTPTTAVEIGYQILGTIAAYDGLSSGSDGAATSYTKATEFVAAVTKTYEVVNHVSLLGKLGVADISLNQPTPAGTNTASNTNVIYGLGMQFDFSKSFAGRALWENLGSVGNASTSESRMSMISAGLFYKF
jgi:hypothetical protein